MLEKEIKELNANVVTLNESILSLVAAFSAPAEEEVEEVEELEPEPEPEPVKKAPVKKATPKKAPVKKAAPKPEPEPEPEPEEEEEPEAEAPTASEQDVRMKMREVVQNKGSQAAMALLSKFGVTTFPELDPSEYGNLYQSACEELEDDGLGI